jgi:hypothetical protein
MILAKEIKDLYTVTIRHWWKKLKKVHINTIIGDVHRSEELIVKYSYYLNW